MKIGKIKNLAKYLSIKANFGVLPWRNKSIDSSMISIITVLQTEQMLISAQWKPCRPDFDETQTMYQSFINLYPTNVPQFSFIEIWLYIAVNEWVARRHLKALGMPHFLGTGSHYYDNEHYRFLVLPRFGLDIEKVFIRHGRKFHVKTAFTLASYVVSNRFL